MVTTRKRNKGEIVIILTVVILVRTRTENHLCTYVKITRICPSRVERIMVLRV